MIISHKKVFVDLYSRNVTCGGMNLCHVLDAKNTAMNAQSTMPLPGSTNVGKDAAAHMKDLIDSNYYPSKEIERVGKGKGTTTPTTPVFSTY